MRTAGVRTVGSGSESKPSPRSIVIGGVVLSWPSGGESASSIQGLVAIALACLCWAIDNNLTSKGVGLGCSFKRQHQGLMAGLVNCGIALTMQAQVPAWPLVVSTMTVGLFGYGVSLVMLVLALRGLGTACTGAYFSAAPFIGGSRRPRHPRGDCGGDFLGRPWAHGGRRLAASDRNT